MIFINDKPIIDCPYYPAPKYVQEGFDFIKTHLGLFHINLHFVPTSWSKQILPNMEIGKLGYACYRNNTCYVFESERGDIYTELSVAIHELRHFVDGAHPWVEEIEPPLQ